MTPIRERAKEILNAIPAGQIKSNDKSGDYQKYTGGLKHETLEANWKAGGIMTGCNAFAGWYASQLGSAHYLGRFDLVTFLPSIGKGHAWIKSASGRRPQYGDILLHTGLHEDVALDFDGNILNRIAAGQGGRSVGYDILCRVRGKGPYNFANLQGWVDLDLYFGIAPAAFPIPGWLPGWWHVTWRGQAYYYYFDRNNQVKWTPYPPSNILQLPGFFSDTGSFSVEGASGVTIHWNASGSVEKLAACPSSGALQMSGTWNGSERLEAVKL
jgi:hypothetical protein